MKVVQVFTVAALLAGSTGAASASFFYPTFEQGQNSASVAVNSDPLVTGRSVGYSDAAGTRSQLLEPSISPNGNPGLSDFAAHR